MSQIAFRCKSFVVFSSPFLSPSFSFMTWYSTLKEQRPVILWTVPHWIRLIFFSWLEWNYAFLTQIGWKWCGLLLVHHVKGFVMSVSCCQRYLPGPLGWGGGCRSLCCKIPVSPFALITLGRYVESMQMLFCLQHSPADFCILDGPYLQRLLL